MEKEYQMLIIGAGAAGSTAATTAASAGSHVAMIERDKIGGTCLNYGCDPTKTLLHSAHKLYQARHAGSYGLHIPQAEADWASVQARVGRVIERIRGGTSGQASAELERKGIDVLEAAGVKTTKRGIEVDATLQTNVPHIWAAGDVSGGLQFTHVAYEQGKLAAQNALAVKQGRQPQQFDDSVIPWVTFTDPALAHVGMTEEQLREKGIQYRVGRMKFSEVERAIADGTTAGFVKLLVDEKDMILGGHVLATGGDDLLSLIVLAMHAGIPAKTLASTIIPYPTMSEGIRWAADRIG